MGKAPWSLFGVAVILVLALLLWYWPSPSDTQDTLYVGGPFQDDATCTLRLVGSQKDIEGTCVDGTIEIVFTSTKQLGDTAQRARPVHSYRVNAAHQIPRRCIKGTRSGYFLSEDSDKRIKKEDVEAEATVICFVSAPKRETSEPDA